MGCMESGGNWPFLVGNDMRITNLIRNRDMGRGTRIKGEKVQLGAHTSAIWLRWVMKVHSGLCLLACLACPPQVWQQERPESMCAGHQSEQSPVMTSETSMRKQAHNRGYLFGPIPLLGFPSSK